jgi:hypothetical protein
VKVGFTGTQRGMSYFQQILVEKRLALLAPELLIHGACVGADYQADKFAAQLAIDRHAYPSNVYTKRVSEQVLRAHEGSSLLYEPTPLAPLTRNKFIVEKCDFLIACPGEEFERLRSGTWATIRYAKKVGRSGVIFYPSGREEQIGPSKVG